MEIYFFFVSKKKKRKGEIYWEREREHIKGSEPHHHGQWQVYPVDCSVEETTLNSTSPLEAEECRIAKSFGNSKANTTSAPKLPTHLRIRTVEDVGPRPPNWTVEEMRAADGVPSEGPMPQSHWNSRRGKQCSTRRCPRHCKFSEELTSSICFFVSSSCSIICFWLCFEWRNAWILVSGETGRGDVFVIFPNYWFSGGFRFYSWFCDFP